MKATTIVLAVCLVIALGVIAAVTTKPAQEGSPQSMTLRELNIVDDQGRTRIVMKVTDAGPRIALRDEQNRARAFIGCTGPAAPGKPSYWEMNLCDANGNPRVLCALQESGAGASLQVRDNTGATRFLTAFTDQGGGALMLKDEKNRNRFTIGMPAGGGYSMHFMDAEGSNLWQAP
ncbi:hypothetical protein GX586_13040 [bacterium]|nr:hypothetical protein [bacterium]